MHLIFTETLFIIVKKGKQPGSLSAPLMNENIHAHIHIHVHTYRGCLLSLGYEQKNDLSPFTTTWIKLAKRNERKLFPSLREILSSFRERHSVWFFSHVKCK